MYRSRRRKPKRRGYVRPSRAKPKTGWSLRQLSGLTGIAVRTIRLYLQRQVLPRPPFKASATRYERRELLYLLAIRRLRVTERLSLAAIRARLQTLSPPELEEFATESLPPGPLADALGIQHAAPPAVRTPSGLGLAPFDRSASSSVIPRWSRIELALGLELHVRDDASPRVVELAARVHDLCAADVAEGR